MTKKEPYMKKTNRVGFWTAFWNLKIVVPTILAISLLLSGLGLPAIGGYLLGLMGFIIGSIMLWIASNLVGAYVISKREGSKTEFKTRRDWIKAELIISWIAGCVIALNALLLYAPPA